MRNCFVPFCDYKNKYSKRMMFQPPRDEETFERWKAALPKKKQFKQFDKVCEQHFDPCDIERTWEHTIQGEKVLMDRGKPRLKKNATPKRNFPTDAEIETWVTLRKPTDTQRKSRRILTKVDAIPKNKSSTVKVPKPSSPPVDVAKTNFEPAAKVDTDPNDPLMVEMVDISEIETPEDQGTTPPNDGFEALYDDIFEVVLPSTLWGFHRDPDRKFIAFTEFSPKCMAVLKSVHIDAKLGFKFYLRSESLLTGNVETGDPEQAVSRLLADLDEYRVCLSCSVEGKTTTDGCLGLINKEASSNDLHCSQCIKALL